MNSPVLPWCEVWAVPNFSATADDLVETIQFDACGVPYRLRGGEVVQMAKGGGSHVIEGHPPPLEVTSTFSRERLKKL